MQYKTCPHCGAHLDFGERCDCGDEKKPLRDDDIGGRQVDPESGKRIITVSFYQGMDDLSSPGGKKKHRVRH